MTTATEPAWLCHARSLLGTREAPGAANDPTIMGWAKRLGTKVLSMLYKGSLHESEFYVRQARTDSERANAMVKDRSPV